MTHLHLPSACGDEIRLSPRPVRAEMAPRPLSGPVVLRPRHIPGGVAATLDGLATGALPRLIHEGPVSGLRRALRAAFAERLARPRWLANWLLDDVLDQAALMVELTGASASPRGARRRERGPGRALRRRRGAPAPRHELSRARHRLAVAPRRCRMVAGRGTARRGAAPSRPRRRGDPARPQGRWGGGAASRRRRARRRRAAADDRRGRAAPARRGARARIGPAAPCNDLGGPTSSPLAPARFGRARTARIMHRCIRPISGPRRAIPPAGCAVAQGDSGDGGTVRLDDDGALLPPPRCRPRPPRCRRHRA